MHIVYPIVSELLLPVCSLWKRRLIAVVNEKSKGRSSKWRASAYSANGLKCLFKNAPIFISRDVPSVVPDLVLPSQYVTENIKRLVRVRE